MRMVCAITGNGKKERREMEAFSMEEVKYLLDIAIILTITKALGLISRKFSLPPVVGALIAGILVGPVCLNWVQPSTIITSLSEIGVIVLMFEAGLGTDIKQLKKSGKASFIIALLGVIVPLMLGYAISGTVTSNMMEKIFIGVILTATSVSITVETLQDMDKLKTPAGTAILGAAIIDDILGIILLSVITSMGESGSSGVMAVGIVLGKMLIFFLLALACGAVVLKFFRWLLERMNEEHKRRVPVFAFAFCLFAAYASELFGIADITGAYIAGIVLCSLSQTDYIHTKVEVVSYMLCTPIFFASIGIKTTLDGFTKSTIIFTVLLCVIAIISKIIGCGLGAKLCKYSNKEAIQIGAGMVSRGEVALIVANKGMKAGLIQPAIFSPVVVMVVVTTLLTPILLKMVFHDNNSQSI